MNRFENESLEELERRKEMFLEKLIKGGEKRYRNFLYEVLALIEFRKRFANT